MAAAKNISMRFRQFEIDRMEDLATEMGFPPGSRADVVRAGLDLLRAERSADYREDVRKANSGIALVDRLLDEYGPHARIAFGHRKDTDELSITIEGAPPPDGVEARLENVEGFGVISLIDTTTGLMIRPASSWSIPLDEWEDGSFEVPLAGCYPRALGTGGRVPLRAPAY
jgi:hypothetical protein